MTEISIPQTTVTQYPRKAYPGMVADLGNTYSKSFLTEVALDWGYGVIRGATASIVTPPLGVEYCKLPASTGDVTNKLVGIVKMSGVQEPQPSISPLRIPIGATVSVLRKGRIYVPIDGDVLVDGPVYLNFTGTGLGKFRGDDATTPKATLITRAKWTETVLTAVGYAELDIDLP